MALADGNPKAVARDQADHFACVDLKDKEGLLSLARAVQEQSGLDGIFTAGTDFSSSVAWVAEKLGLPGISYAAAMRATDKCLMREAFDARCPARASPAGRVRENQHPASCPGCATPW